MSVYPIILSQNEFLSQESLHFPYEERGLQFGDGIYEVIRIYNGNYYLLEEHIDRLFRSTQAIKIDFPYTKEVIKKRLLDLLIKNNMTSDGKVYLQVTRGSATRDHVFPLHTKPNFYAYVTDQERNLTSLRNGVGAITERDVRWENCYIKSLNLLPNVMAKQAAFEKGCYDAILHKDGLVTECSSANVYLVKNNKIYTHPTTNRILYGCVRLRVEQFAKELHMSLREEPFRLEDITTADELFLTSSTSEIMPIVSVDGKKVANGTPGEITRKLQQAYEHDANITTDLIESTK